MAAEPRLFLEIPSQQKQRGLSKDPKTFEQPPCKAALYWVTASPDPLAGVPSELVGDYTLFASINS